MSTVTAHEAEAQFNALLDRAAAGEDIVIEKEGKPVARLTACTPPVLKPRRGGQWRGQVRMSEDFDAPLPPDIMRAFEGLDP